MSMGTRTGSFRQRPSGMLAHARRKLVEITRNGSGPIAADGVTLIRELHAIEAEIYGPPAPRLAVRQERSAIVPQGVV